MPYPRRALFGDRYLLAQVLAQPQAELKRHAPELCRLYRACLRAQAKPPLQALLLAAREHFYQPAG